MNDTLDTVLGEMRARQLQLQEEAFSAPPKNFDEFNQRLGRWLEIKETMEVLVQRAKGTEDE